MIKVLDSFVSDKIAAGEVIERPLSIVKELVENSVDAGASEIIVEIRNGGKSYIRITDNGCGIPSTEVETAFERHATGKIETVSDLDHIETLGFRGEALASIAAVSRVTLYTKTSDEDLGTKLTINGGRVVAKDVTGMNGGTTIVVEDVFYNTPARRKFMRTDAAESSAVIDLIQRVAIYYSGISFRMMNNGQNVLSTTGNGSIIEAIMSIYPTKDHSELIRVDSGIVSGYISDPGTTKTSRRGQIFFVNGRIVNSDVIEKGIKEGYGDRLFSGFPIAILFIDVDPSTVDVNIHPNKKEVKFVDAKEISNAVSVAIKQVIASQNAIPSAVHHNDTAVKDPKRQSTETTLSEQFDLKSYLAEKRASAINDEKDTVDSLYTSENNDIIITKKDTDDPHIEIESPGNRPFEFDDLSFIAYLFDTYIVMMSGDGILYVLDQHAAHERILYESLVGRYESEDHLSQPMLIPLTIETSSDIYNDERTWMRELKRFGYDISDFGTNTFIIREIPEYMTRAEAEVFARAFMEGYESNCGGNRVVIDKLITRSCKSAVKANDRLSRPEISDLLDRLSQCVNPFSCPHGRPTFIKISKYDIERAFKRK